MGRSRTAWAWVCWGLVLVLAGCPARTGGNGDDGSSGGGGASSAAGTANTSHGVVSGSGFTPASTSLSATSIPTAASSGSANPQSSSAVSQVAGVSSSTGAATSAASASVGASGSSSAAGLDGGVPDAAPIVCGGGPLNCGAGEVPHCSAEGQGSCCGGTWSQYCERPGVAGCFRATDDCTTLTRCAGDGGGVFACTAGESPHCMPNGQGVCCGGGNPVFCAGTGCWSVGTDCTTIQSCGDAGLSACPTGSTTYCEPSGQLSCCTSQFPVHCAGTGCWQTGTDCATITTCGADGGVHACGSGSVAHCTGTADLVCCPSGSLFCDVPAGASCWSGNTDCSTVRWCPYPDGGGHLAGCTAGFTVDCTNNQCRQ
ncbi:MAG: hypothetical protein HY904_09855 [Deltaproteobacteria bacterium]|nr:hypothetical protein [Deltaproteobacteria bacterium]